MITDYATITGMVVTPIIAYIGVMAKKYMDSVINHTQKSDEGMLLHTKVIAELTIRLETSEKRHEIENGKLTSEIDRLRTDLKNAQYAIETKTEHLQQGFKMMISMRDTVNQSIGMITRLDQDLNGLKISVKTNKDEVDAKNAFNKTALESAFKVLRDHNGQLREINKK